MPDPKPATKPSSDSVPSPVDGLKANETQLLEKQKKLNATEETPGFDLAGAKSRVEAQLKEVRAALSKEGK